MQSKNNRIYSDADLMNTFLSGVDYSLSNETLTAILFLNILSLEYKIIDIKKHQIDLDHFKTIPINPSLDRESLLHKYKNPYISSYLWDKDTNNFFNISVIFPKKIIKLTFENTSQTTIDNITNFLKENFSEFSIKIVNMGMAYRRAGIILNSQITLHDICSNKDQQFIEIRITKLKDIAAYMEKKSRVFSWGVRTIYGPIMAVIIFLIHLFVTDKSMAYPIIGLIGGILIYIGIKSVQLNQMGAILFKRILDYEFIYREKFLVKKVKLITKSNLKTNEKKFLSFIKRHLEKDGNLSAFKNTMLSIYAQLETEKLTISDSRPLNFILQNLETKKIILKKKSNSVTINKLEIIKRIDEQILQIKNIINNPS